MLRQNSLRSLPYLTGERSSPLCLSMLKSYPNARWSGRTRPGSKASYTWNIVRCGKRNTLDASIRVPGRELDQVIIRARFTGELLGLDCGLRPVRLDFGIAYGWSIG